MKINRQIITYAIVFVLAFLVVSTVLFGGCGSQRKKAEQPLPEADTTAVAAVDTTAAPDTTATLAPDTLVVADETLPDPVVEYNNLMLLRKQLIDFYSHGEKQTYSHTEIDSIVTGFTAQIDSLAIKQQRYIARINELSRTRQTQSVQSDSLRAQVLFLQEKISRMETEHQRQINALQTGDSQKTLREAANMWENMDPANAAQSMLPLQDTEIVAVLRQMNVRRASKILNEMPENRAASLLKVMSTP